MANGIDTLTYKEKEALRLLLAGHDAKSSANELGISVHTVHDRLRNARRKMDVSSSREAARILGDIEGTTPQNTAHKHFGMADSAAAPDSAVLRETRHAARSRTVWLAGGMLTMSIFVAVVAISLVARDAPEIVEPQSAPETESVAPVESAQSMDRVEAFIALIDAGDWEESWQIAGGYFQSQITAEEWAAVVEPVRQPLGEVESREVAVVQQTESLPGAPEGNYEVVQFGTVFSGREERAIETVIMMASDDGWQVAGYFIR